ncbi:hypothetical protein APX70_01776 [Pseudomonas syringae pv. maculicola]|uniref:Uncharacterized protein n=1 Tax=Pseudomonas syringae pv. maculicola TaxID=59511 RepID=A0A3M2W7C3_PSEYM|nr:hypothetical protein APX70_01776 [Pseudomonas syringae pv. maculicola]
MLHRARQQGVEQRISQRLSNRTCGTGPRGQQGVEPFDITVDIGLTDAGATWRGNTHQQVSPGQQRVDVLGLQQQPALLSADQAIFHHVRDADTEIHADNPRGPLERVRRTHAGFQLIGLGRVAFERQQPGTEYLGLRIGFQREQFKQ